MKYIAFKNNHMTVDTRQLRKTNPNQYLLKVKAIGLNRAQLLQKQGKYPASKQDQQYLGLQAVGEIYQNETKIGVGMALLSGGSYAQYVNVNKNHVMMIPKNLDFIRSAAIPEVWLTAYQILNIGKLSEGDNVVIYAGASGVGTAAIQICKLYKANPFVVVSSQQKIEFCAKLGAKGVSYKQQGWENKLIELNNNKPFNIVLDCVCQSHYEKTIKLLDVDGRWVLYGTMSGTKPIINLAHLLAKRIQLLTSTLKSRSADYKSKLISDFSKDILPHFQTGSVVPIIDKVYKFKWSDNDSQIFEDAHKFMQQNGNSGKILIQYLD